MPMSKKLPEQQNDLPRQENMRLCVLALRSQQPDTMAKVQICWVMGLLGAGCSEGTCVPCHSDATRHNQPSVAVQAPPPLLLLHQPVWGTYWELWAVTIFPTSCSEPWQRVGSQDKFPITGRATKRPHEWCPEGLFVAAGGPQAAYVRAMAEQPSCIPGSAEAPLQRWSHITQLLCSGHLSLFL